MRLDVPDQRLGSLWRYCLRWLGVLGLVILTPPALAHRFAPSLWDIHQIGASVFSATWKTPIEQVSSVPLEPVIPANCARQSASPWVREGTGRIQQQTWDCPNGLTGTRLEVSGVAAQTAVVMVNVTLLDGATQQFLLDRDNPNVIVPATPDAVSVVSRYTVLGIEHILLGPDHLLFVLGLLLLVRQGRPLIVTITAFTAGHSVTLALATLGIIRYPVAIVECLIAVSIFLLAVELSRPDGPGWLWRRPWWLASGFGLLHGMGFAGALAETGLPASNVPLALLFFNIGIEVGQLLFIGTLLVLHNLLREWTARWWWLPQVPVVVLGVLSARWCIERGLAVLT